ncbi:MAG: hypothetical protein K2L73_04910, partial [Muribaculaceae bacterium]|nr:hypothetical protein [Muribaculaceae bacterium]
TIMTYTENGKSAAVASQHNGSAVIAMGFPFETIRSANARDMLMAQLLLYLRTTKLPIEAQPHPSVKFDGDYRFPTGIPASRENAYIEITD